MENNKETVIDNKDGKVEPVKVKKPETVVSKPEPEEFFNIDYFMDTVKPISPAERIYYKGNYSNGELRTIKDWESITGLK